MAQYNWRTSGAVSHIKKEKTNMNTKQEAECIGDEKHCQCMDCSYNRAEENYNRMIN